MDSTERRKLIKDRGGCESKSSKPCKGQLEVHHVDRNPANNKRSNLKVVCKGHHPNPGTRQGSPKTGRKK